MRYIHGLLLAVVTVLAVILGTVGVASAAGELLSNGAGISGKLSVVFTGEALLLEDMGIPAGMRPDVLCSVLMEGETATNGELVEIDIVLDLEEKTPLKCTDDAGICTTVTVTALNLPWDLTFELMAVAPTMLIIYSAFNFTINCTTIIGKVEDTCEGKVTEEGINEAEGLLTEFGTVELEEIENEEHCTQGGANALLIGGDITSWKDPGVGANPLSISN